ncbi:MAG: choice-of-anchor Q domain-containing protein, partial [Ignavibacteriaceae bacterium]
LDSVYFVNNTFVGNINCSKLPAIDLKTSEERRGHLTIKNNVFVNKFPGGAITVIELLSYDIDYKIYYTPNSPYIIKFHDSNKSLDYMQNMGYDINSYDEKPIFNNYDWKFSKTESVYLNYDFSIMDGSTSVDNGTQIGLYRTDINGIVRPQGAGWDIGAFEVTLKEDGQRH